MTHSTLGRTLIGAALTVMLSATALAPASAATLPVITWDSVITEGATYVYGEVPAEPTCTAVEDATPVACTVTGYDTSVGDHQLVATAVAFDDETVIATETINYSVTGWTLKGFYKPVRMTAMNKVKAGSTVPLKFKVYEGADKAKSVAVVASFTAQQYDCTTLVPIGDPTSVTRTGKGFQLKYRHGAFHQNWKTPKLPKAAKVKGKKVPATPACYLVTMTTQDGSALSATFRLR